MGYEAYQKLIGRRVRILTRDRYQGCVGVIRRISLISDVLMVSPCSGCGRA